MAARRSASVIVTPSFSPSSPETLQDIDQVEPGAFGIQLDRQDQVEMETMPDIQPPDVREPLDRIAGMGKDDAVEEGETPPQGILQGAPDQRAAVGLQMGLGQPGLLPRAEDPQGVGPGGDDKFLRRIGTEGSRRSSVPLSALSFRRSHTDRPGFHDIRRSASSITLLSNASLAAVFPLGLQLRDLLLFEGVEGDLADQRAGEVVPEFDLPGAAPADQMLLAVGDQRLLRLGGRPSPGPSGRRTP